MTGLTRRRHEKAPARNGRGFFRKRDPPGDTLLLYGAFAPIRKVPSNFFGGFRKARKIASNFSRGFRKGPFAGKFGRPGGRGLRPRPLAATPDPLAVAPTVALALPLWERIAYHRSKRHRNLPLRWTGFGPAFASAFVCLPLSVCLAQYTQATDRCKPQENFSFPLTPPLW